MAETITFTNQKGGVGKSTLAMNFGVRLKMAGAIVLFVDMDPQCNLTYSMGVDNPARTIYDVLLGRTAAQSAVIHAEEGDIIAASPNLSTLDIKLSGTGREYLLRNALRAIEDQYDFIIIDSPPTLGLLTINILAAANGVIIPALADVFSLQGIGQLYTTIQTVRTHCNPGLQIVGIVLSRHTDRFLLSRELREMMLRTAEQIQSRVFQAAIRESVVVRESQAKRQSIFKYSPRSKQTADYDQFVLEYLRYAGQIKKRVNQKERII